MAYKSIGTFDPGVLNEIYDDITPVFEEIADSAIDITVVEVGPLEEGNDPELWHDDYSISDGGWAVAGVFEDDYSADDATRGFPEGDALAVFDYSDKQHKLVVRKTDD